MKRKGLNPQDYVKENEEILYSTWTKIHYKGGIEEYKRLEKAKKIHEDAALESASWGMFQIMGFNYQSCGEKNVKEFVKAMEESEIRQLRLSAIFMKKAGLIPYLQNKDWAGFSKRYNGPAYTENKYDVKLEAAYKKYKK